MNCKSGCSSVVRRIDHSSPKSTSGRPSTSTRHFTRPYAFCSKAEGSKASDTTQYLLGYLASSINGTIFGLVFLYLIRPLIPLGHNRIGNLFAGQIVGLGLSVVALAWWTPANFPEFHPGAFSHNLGSKIIIGTFVWHAVYFLQLTSFSDVLGRHPWRARAISVR